MHYAKQCYKTLVIMLFGCNESDNPLKYPEHIDDEIIDIHEYPAFCFNIVTYFLDFQLKFIRARLLINIFNFLFCIFWFSALLYM